MEKLQPTTCHLTSSLSWGTWIVISTSLARVHFGLVGCLYSAAPQWWPARVSIDLSLWPCILWCYYAKVTIQFPKDESTTSWQEQTTPRCFAAVLNTSAVYNGGWEAESGRAVEYAKQSKSWMGASSKRWWQEWELGWGKRQTKNWTCFQPIEVFVEHTWNYTKRGLPIRLTTTKLIICLGIRFCAVLKALRPVLNNASEDGDTFFFHLFKINVWKTVLAELIIFFVPFIWKAIFIAHRHQEATLKQSGSALDQYLVHLCSYPSAAPSTSTLDFSVIEIKNKLRGLMLTLTLCAYTSPSINIFSDKDGV